MTPRPEPSSELLKLSARGSTLVVAGEIDASNSDDLRRAIDDMPVGDRTIVTESVSFIDCAGLTTLLAATITSRQAGWQLVVSRPSRVVDRIVELTETGDVLSIDRGETDVGSDDRGGDVAP